MPQDAMLDLRSLNDALPAKGKSTADGLEPTIRDGGGVEDTADGFMAEEEIDPLRAKKTAKNKRKKENAKRNKEAALKEAKALDGFSEGAATIDKDNFDQSSSKGGLQPEKGRVEETDSNIPSTVRYPSTSPDFEIKITEKGCGLFALRSFKEGDVLFREASILPETNSLSQLLFEAAYTLTSQKNRDRYNALYSSCHCGKNPCIETPFKIVHETNGFQFNGPLSKGEKNTSRVYELASRINNACQPNTVRTFTKEKVIVIQAVEEIKKGEEVTLDYMGVGRGTLNGWFKRYDHGFRQRYIKIALKFWCRCNNCLNHIPLPLERLRIADAMVKDNAPSVPNSAILGAHTAEDLAAAQAIQEWSQHLLSAAPYIWARIAEKVNAISPHLNKAIQLDFVVDCVVVGYTTLLYTENILDLSRETLVVILTAWRLECLEFVKDNLQADLMVVAFKLYRDLLQGLQ